MRMPAIESATVALHTVSLLDADLLRRIRGEYREMPGMRLTCEQAARQWSLDRVTCRRLLELLVDAGFLTQDGNRRYARAHAGY